LTTVSIRDRQENVVAGIIWMLATMMWFIALDTVAKELLTRAQLPLVQVVWARFFFHFAIALAGLLIWRSHIVSKVPLWQIMRSALLFLTTVLFNAGLQTTPLATATAIMFLSPIILTGLSMPFLGEYVGPRRWFGVAVGFLGALIIIRPGTEGFNFGALFLLMAALVNSVYQLATRRVSHHDTPYASFFHTALAGALLSSFAVPFAWQPPEPMEWILLITMGVFGGVGHLFLIFAFDRAPAAVVAPFAYSALLWASIAGYAFFNEIPDFWTIFGAMIITASGLYIFHRERVAAHAARGRSRDAEDAIAGFPPSSCS
jgi:drug/metabolite transporter (DMT)-like permease